MGTVYVRRVPYGSSVGREDFLGRVEWRSGDKFEIVYRKRVGKIRIRHRNPKAFRVHVANIHNRTLTYIFIYRLNIHTERNSRLEFNLNIFRERGT